LLTLLCLFRPIFGQGKCTPSSFQDISLLGGQVLHFTTQYYSNLSFSTPAEANHYPKIVTGLNACELTITYTHQGYNDTINTVVWLPSAEDWTGRLMGIGGGGWSAGPETATMLPWAASEGFAVVATDGGHIGQDITWSLVSPGNVNWVLLQDFASTALNDAATLGKAIVKTYYGTEARYSYWNGCSTGGRQGYMLAQRFPEQYDGILATAPAIYWNELMMQLFWPQVVMNEHGMQVYRMIQGHYINVEQDFPLPASSKSSIWLRLKPATMSTDWKMPSSRCLTNATSTPRPLSASSTSVHPPTSAPRSRKPQPL
jgi:feruloyl esterase